MIRDLLGRKIKSYIPAEHQDVLEKFYKQGRSIFQVVRSKPIRRMGGVFVELEVLNITTNTGKLKRFEITLQEFRERKFFETLNGLQKHLGVKRNKRLHNVYFENTLENVEMAKDLIANGCSTFSKYYLENYYSQPFTMIEKNCLFSASNNDIKAVNYRKIGV